MATNTNGANTIANQSEKTVKTNKAKAPRAAKKPSSVASAKAAAPTTPTPTEILFDQPTHPFLNPEPPYIWIDYPQQEERLLGPIYNIRMGIGGAEQADLSIDGGPWLACEERSGYWWYDWSNIQPGKHTLVARIRTTDGRWFRTPVRNCEYRP